MRDGPQVDRVRVWVSPAMKRLRTFQSALNTFLWSTEVGYHFITDWDHPELTNPSLRLIDCLPGLRPEAWYLSNQGRPKYDPSVGDFLRDVQRNETQIFLAVLVNMASALELYLDERAGPIKVSGKRGWGEYLETLAVPQLMTPAAPGQPLRVETVVSADLFRLIRNRFVHSLKPSPKSSADPDVARWHRNLSNVLARHWGRTAAEADAIVDEAIDDVIGKVESGVVRTKRAGKPLPADFFTTVFAFTNFDNLAFEIEEALVGPLALGEGLVSVGRKRDDVRRTDLVQGG